MAFGSSTGSLFRDDPFPQVTHSHSLVFSSQSVLQEAITRASSHKSERTRGACGTPCAGRGHEHESCSPEIDSHHQLLQIFHTIKKKKKTKQRSPSSVRKPKKNKITKVEKKKRKWSTLYFIVSGKCMALWGKPRIWWPSECIL